MPRSTRSPRSKLPDPQVGMTIMQGLLLIVLRILVGQGVLTEDAAAQEYWKEYDRCGWAKERRGERIAG